MDSPAGLHVLNPDQQREPFRPQRIRNAFVVCGHFVVDLTALDYGALGLAPR